MTRVYVPSEVLYGHEEAAGHECTLEKVTDPDANRSWFRCRYCRDEISGVQEVGADFVTKDEYVPTGKTRAKKKKGKAA